MKRNLLMAVLRKGDTLSAVAAVPDVSQRVYLPGSEDIYLEWVLVTPDMALDWLTNEHAPNRNRKSSRVESYQRDMEHGDWLVYSSFAFDTEGKMIDGQHRAEAVVESGIPQWFVVVRGLERNTQRVIDRNAIRKFSDDLTISGAKSGTTIAAMCRCIWFYQLTGEIEVPGGKTNKVQGGATDAELERILEANPSIIDHMTTQAPITGIPASKYSAFKWLISLSEDYETIEAFNRFDKILRTGMADERPESRTVIVFREKLMRDKASPTNKMKPKQRLAFLVRTWNAYLKGEVLEKLMKSSPQLIAGCPIVPTDFVPEVE